MSGSRQCKEFAGRLGADLAGVADLGPFKRAGGAVPADLLEPYTCAVSIAVRLDDAIISGIRGEPTPEYARHYRAVNAALDSIAARLVSWITEQGFRGLAVPASEVVDQENLLGSVSHKAIARMAGLGWQGKSLLIVSPQYGPRIRLASVLTDLPLRPDRPLKNRCGTCAACATACPVRAIKNVRTANSYASREQALRFERCIEHTRQFRARPELGASLCGVCVKACPFGRGLRRSEDHDASPLPEVERCLGEICG
jgi:epoxyqueuosine reductase QueG